MHIIIVSHSNALQHRSFFKFFIYTKVLNQAFKIQLKNTFKNLATSCNLISFPNLHNQIYWKKNGTKQSRLLFSRVKVGVAIYRASEMCTIHVPLSKQQNSNNCAIPYVSIQISIRMLSHFGDTDSLCCGVDTKKKFLMEALNMNSLHVMGIKGISTHQELITFHFILFFFLVVNTYQHSWGVW